MAVELDDLTGGLLTLGLRPAGWVVPQDAIITLPPRVLSGVKWAPPPQPDSTVFITENPSVIAAAADHAATTRPVYVVCTSGTPAASEIAALYGLVAIGWNVRVRADFDVACIDHVRALLNGIPGAQPWRMSADEYQRLAQSHRATVGLLGAVPETPWDPGLQHVMDEYGLAVYEESLLADLLDDLTGNSEQ